MNEPCAAGSVLPGQDSFQMLYMDCTWFFCCDLFNTDSTMLVYRHTIREQQQYAVFKALKLKATKSYHDLD